MNLQNRLGRILCGTGLALALTVGSATWASSAVQRGGQAGPRAAQHSASSRVDINTASADRLKSLPGIGDVYAKRIIAGRPYHSKDQLLTKGILPRPVYDNLKSNIVAHRIKK